MEMKEMQERQADITRINEKLMKVFDQKTKSQRSSSRKSLGSNGKSEELMKKIDQVINIEKERLERMNKREGSKKQGGKDEVGDGLEENNGTLGIQKYQESSSGNLREKEN